MLKSENFVRQNQVFENNEFTEERINDNKIGKSLKLLIEELRAFSSSFLNLFVIGPKETNWSLSLASKLIEDEGGSFGFKMSYYDFYCSYLKGISKVF